MTGWTKEENASNLVTDQAVGWVLYCNTPATVVLFLSWVHNAWTSSRPFYCCNVTQMCDLITKNRMRRWHFGYFPVCVQLSSCVSSVFLPIWLSPASLAWATIQLAAQINKLTEWLGLAPLPFQPKGLSIQYAWVFCFFFLLSTSYTVRAADHCLWWAPANRQVAGECCGSWHHMEPTGRPTEVLQTHCPTAFCSCLRGLM